MEKNRYQFDITPHIVKQLGEQLVSDEITALSELIKNSYDADASYASVEINTSGQYQEDNLIFPEHNGYIIVEDDGFGMNEEEIIKSWLLISYSQKRQLKERGEKTPGKRTPLGDKGLGRLSTQRLASICEILTKKEKDEGVHLAFNWKDFEIEERLTNVKIHTEEYYTDKIKGTKLVLTDLKHPEVWKGKNLEKFKGQVSQIISPYKESRPFDVYLTVNGIEVDLNEVNEQLRDLALSRFEFDFNAEILTIKGRTKLNKFIGKAKDDFSNFMEPDNGNKFFKYLSKKYKFIKRSSDGFYIEFEKKFDFYKDISGLEIYNGERANPGSFNGIIDEFGYDRWLSQEKAIIDVFGKLTDYSAFAQSQSGIKLFRNGFAVIPFGIDGEDWLKLGDSQTGGGSYYGLRPVNVIGYFAIDEGVNKNLKDKTDRQGLVSNPFSRNFFTMTFFIRDEINRYQQTIRRTYQDFIKEYRTENSGIKTVKQAFKELKDTQEKSSKISQEYRQSISAVKKAIKDSEVIVESVEKNPLFSTDLEKELIAKVSELLEQLGTIQKTLNELEEIVIKTEKLNEVINILEPKINFLEDQLSNFSELAGLGLTAESVSHEFSNIADRLAEKTSYYSSKLKADKLNETDVYVLIEYINSTVNGLKVQLRHLDPALKYHREKKPVFKLSDFFEDEKSYYEDRFKNRNIDFQLDIQDDFQIRFNKGKLVQIIDNLINNSEYWLLERRNNEPDFLPKINVKIEAPWVYFSDNGYGIPPSVENQLFEPFVTTKTNGKGRGLGLFIIQQLLSSSGCTITLEPERNTGKRKYIFAINLSNIMKS